MQASNPTQVTVGRATVAVVALAGLLVMGGLARAQEAPRELLANGSFELLDSSGGPESWGARDWGDSKQAASKVAKDGRFGARCLELLGKSGPLLYDCFSRPIALGDNPPSQLLLTLSYRADENVGPEISVATFAEDFAAKEWNTPVLSAEGVTLEPSPKQWRTVSWHLRLLPSARQVVVVARIHGAGALLVDGVSLKAHPTEVECALLTPGVAVSAKGDRRASLRLTNRTERELPVRVTLEVQAPKAKGKSTDVAVKLAPGKPQDVTVNFSYPLDRSALVACRVLSDKGDVVYDELDSALPGLLDGWVTAPAFRATILPGMALTELAARGTVNAVPELRRQLKLEGKIVGLGLDIPNVPLDADGNWEIKTPVGAMLTGKYAVHLRALQDGRPVAEFDLPVVKPEPRPSMAGYDERMRYYLTGQMRLPLGVCMAVDEADLEVVAAAGFNTVVLPSRLASASMMETAQRLGLVVIVSSASAETDFWKNQITRQADLPPLGGWYMIQRPEAQTPPVPPNVVGALYGSLVDLDPRHPVCLAVGSLSRLEHYSSLCDILMPWTDPEPVGDLRAVDVLLTRATELCAGRRPVWPLIQMTGAAYAADVRLDPTGNGRPPSAAEYRCMAYLSFARGAAGLFSYAYRVSPSRTQRDYLVSRDAPELWQCVKQVNQELRALTPILLEGEPVTVQSDNPQVALRGLKYRDAYYVLAVNPSAAPAPLSLRVPGMKGNVLEVAFATRKVQGAAAGEFADQIEAQGVRVYMGR